MTAQWLALKVGDVIIDHKCGDAPREVLSVARASGKPEQRGNTRTMIAVPNLRRPEVSTVLVSTEDIGGARFTLRRR